MNASTTADKAWLRSMEAQLAQCDVDDDDLKVVACMRNLTGPEEARVRGAGKFNCSRTPESGSKKSCEL